MTRIEYTLLKEYCELNAIHGKRLTSVSVTLQRAAEGTLCIGELTLAVKGGKTYADVRRLPDGVYRPLLLTGRASMPLEPLLISGDVISPLPTEDSVIRMLLRRVSSLEERLRELDAEQKRLDAEIMGKDPIKELFE